MRFLSFSAENGNSWGVATNDGVIDLGARFGGSLQETLAENQLNAMMDRAAGLETDVALDVIRFKTPIAHPEKIVCIGVNYANRNAEYHDKSEEPKWPSLFMRTIDSFAPHNEAIWRPPESHQLDYEGEIALVIGKEGHRVPQEAGLDYIAGYTLSLIHI